MPSVITGEALRALVAEGDVVIDGDTANADGVKYDFRMGDRILKAKHRVPIDLSTSSDQSELVVVEPGEVVFVLTQELLNLPLDMFAQLSPKRSLSQAGIQILGGSEIDPGYKGRLLIGLHNVSSTAFPLRPSRKIIAATFYRLKGDEVVKVATPSKSLADFPDELVEVMARYQPVALTVVSGELAALRLEVADVRRSLDNHNSWYNQLSESLSKHDRQIGELLAGLDREATTRQKGEDTLSQAVTGMQKQFTFVRGAAWAIGSILALIVLPVVVIFVARVLWPGN